MPIKLPSFRARRDVYPPDLWTKCPQCSDMLFNKQLEKNDRICPTCDHHFRLSAEARLELLLDPGSFRERDAGLQSVDPLGFVDQKPYPERVATAQAQTGLRDAAVRGTGAIEGQAVSICVMDFGFMGGSMGAVVGEKVARAAEDALAEPNALIGFAGARVAAGTIAQELPQGFQRSEFLFEHGFVDRVVHRRAVPRGAVPPLPPPPLPPHEDDERAPGVG